MRTSARVWEIFTEDGPIELLKKTWIRFFYNSSWFKQLPKPIVYNIFESRSNILPWVSDANPLDLRHANVEDIKFYQGEGPSGFGAIEGGEWDQPACPIDEHEPIKSILLHFHENTPWNETPLFKEYVGRLDAGNPYWRCASESALYEYFEEINQLYTTIREEGYQSQAEIYKRDPSAVRIESTDAPHPLLNEVSVNVYRDGTLAKKGAGNHRLAVAKALDIESIPVVVRARHEQWQIKRRKMRSANSPSKLDDELRQFLNHPDMQDIRPYYRD